MKPRNIQNVTDFDIFVPMDGEAREPLTIGYDEVEALRLVDYLGQSQEEAAISMGVSRGTVWRCVDSGRRKMAAMLVEGRPLLIRPDGQDTGEMIRFP
ncbi:MAG: DUF134 domain-containing protein [Methanomassiliicoccales archaeon]|nr:DUF134 domain-containing protein [Methanomassiliicoccales archaeon]